MQTISLTRIRSIIEALSIYQQACLSDDNTLVFDFSHASFIDTNFTALLGAVIKACQESGKAVLFNIPNEHLNVIKALKKNGFIPAFNSQFDKLFDTYGTMIPYQAFALKDVAAQKTFLRGLNLRNRGVTNLSDRLMKAVEQAINELFDNAREHSRSNTGIFTAGQFYPHERCLAFNASTTPASRSHHPCRYALKAHRP